MFGSEFRPQPFPPLFRGGLLTLALAALWLGVLCIESRTPAAASEPVASIVAVESPATDPRAAWPSTVLRLWLLVPQLLPDHDR
jgi:hypothetical protein